MHTKVVLYDGSMKYECVPHICYGMHVYIHNIYMTFMQQHVYTHEPARGEQKQRKNRTSWFTLDAQKVQNQRHKTICEKLFKKMC